MPDTLTPAKPPSQSGYSAPEAANVRRVVFEGQYSQRARTGPNAVTIAPKLTFRNLTKIQKDYIVDFMREKEGAEAFFYTLPGEDSPRLWTCASWEAVPEKNKVDWRVRISLIEEFDITS